MSPSDARASVTRSWHIVLIIALLSAGVAAAAAAAPRSSSPGAGATVQPAAPAQSKDRESWGEYLTTGQVVTYAVALFVLGFIIGAAGRSGASSVPRESLTQPDWEPMRAVIRTQMLQQGIPDYQADDALRRMDRDPGLRRRVLQKAGLPMEAVPEAKPSSRARDTGLAGCIMLPLLGFAVSWKLVLPVGIGVLGYFLGSSRR